MMASPVERIHVLERGMRRRAGICAWIGRDINVDPTLVHQFCFSNPSLLAHDICTLVGSVKLADRAIRRKPFNGWARQLRVSLPVYEYSLWSQEKVSTTLADCLNYLTGDQWLFDFCQRSGQPAASSQAHVVGLPEGEYVTIPYSHGLDSYAQLKLLQAAHPTVNTLCIFTDSRGSTSDWKSFCKTFKRPEAIRAIRVPFRVNEPKHCEPSFRSRAFLFYLLAGYSAALAGANRVVIPENGQGSLGGSLVRLGAEAPHRSCHPGFTSRLAKLISLLMEKKIQFDHIALFQTKGQVLQALSSIEAPESWLKQHSSCSHDQRYANLYGKKVHCGVCGGCVLRRVSAIAARIQDDTPYLFSNLKTPNFESALPQDVKPGAIRAFRDLAGNNLRSMKRLANFYEQPDSPTLWSMSADLARYTNLSIDDANRKLREFIKQHADDWELFINYCGANSWPAQLSEA